MSKKRFAIIPLGIVLMLVPGLMRAQQGDNVVEAARKAQEARKTAPRAKLSIDNDNLDTLTGTVNVVGQSVAPPADQAKIEAAGKTIPAVPAEKPMVKDEAYWRAQFATANKKLADDAHELDILQREYNLKQEQFYTNPMASLKEEYSRADLNDTKQKIDDKTATVASDKQAIADLQDALRAAGGDPGWENPAPTAVAPAIEQ